MRPLARLFIGACSLCAAALAAPSLAPTELRCEFRINPIGLGETRPRLSWKLSALDTATRGLRQTAWQVLVASTAEALAANQGDCWDSGEVASEVTNGIAYAGRALKSRDRCF